MILHHFFCKQNRENVEHLIGRFASDMAGLLGNLVQGWTSFSDGDVVEAARKFTATVGERTHRPNCCRSRQDYSQELPDSQEDPHGFDIDIPNPFLDPDPPQGSDHNRNDPKPTVSGPNDKRARDHDEQPVVAKKKKLDPVSARRRFFFFPLLLILSNNLLFFAAAPSFL